MERSIDYELCGISFISWGARDIHITQVCLQMIKREAWTYEVAYTDNRLVDWIVFSCTDSLTEFLIKFLTTLKVSFQVSTTTGMHGKFNEIWVSRMIFRESLGRHSRPLRRREEVFNLIMAIEYTVGNWFDSKTLIVNYLMTQARDPHANWNKFVRLMKNFEDLYDEEYVYYFEIYEIALHSHDKLFLFPVMVQKFHQLFLTTLDVKLFTIAQRYFIKTIVEIITSTEIAANTDEFICWFDAMSDDRRECMYQFEEAQSNRYRMQYWRKCFMNQSDNQPEKKMPMTPCEVVFV